MKGHIFQLLEDFITEIAGHDTLDEILDACEFQTKEPFIRTGNYPDRDLIELVRKTTKKLGISTEEAHRAFGMWIFPHLTKLVSPGIVEVGHAKSFLMMIGQIHEVELKKLWPDASPPSFTVRDTGPGTMRMTYDSPRQMFELVEGVLKSVAEFYEVDIDFEKEMQVGDRGHAICHYSLSFDPPEESSP